tara:strand:+ start:2369 stop:4633 length:2265 start_codon:yes stop_codon:yes gene_type:complete
MADLKMPDGKILRFPDGTPDDVLDKAAQEYISGNRTAQSGTRIIAELPQGGKVFEDASGKRSFSDGAYVTSDPATIAKIMEGSTAGGMSTEGFDKQTLEQVGMPAAVATQFIRGGGLGSFADEALGAVMGDDAQQAMRATAGAMERQYPKTSLGANIAGGVTSAAGTLAAAPAAVTAAIGKSVAPTGGRLLPMAARSFGVGAVGGGVGGTLYGYGEGTDPESRMREAQSGAMFGAGTGGTLGIVAPLAARGAKNVMDYAKGTDVSKIAQYLGISRNAANVIKSTFERGGGIEDAVGNIQRAGEQGMLADAGQSAQALLDASASSGGTASQTVGTEISKRAAGSLQQLEGGLNEVLGDAPIGPRNAVAKIAEQTKEARSTAYGAAYGAPINYASPEGAAIEGVVSRIPSRILNEAISEANEDMVAKGLKNQQIMASVDDAGNVSFSNPMNVQQLDYLKRALNTLSEANRGEFNKQTAASLRYAGLAKDLRAAVGDAVVDPTTGARLYDDAVKLGGETIREQNAFALGRDALKPKTEIEDVIEELGIDPSDAQIEAAKLGMRSALRTALDNVKSVPSDPDLAARQINEFVKLVSSENSRKKIREVLGDDAPAMLKQLDEASQTALVRSAVSVNSKTAVRGAIKGDIDDLTAKGVVRSAMSGEPLNTSKELIQAVTGETRKFDADQKQQIYNDIARALTEKRGKSAEAALRYIQGAMEGRVLTEPQRDFAAQQLATALFAGTSGQLGRSLQDAIVSE